MNRLLTNESVSALDASDTVVLRDTEQLFATLRYENKLDTGADSDVFRNGNYVVKNYRNGITLGMIESYADLHQRAFEYLRNDPELSNIHLLVGEVEYRVKFEIERIIAARQTDSSAATQSLSRYVAGPNLQMIFPAPWGYAFGKAAAGVSSLDSDDRLIVEIFNTSESDLSRYKSNFRGILDLAEGKLDNALGSPGLHLDYRNVKIAINQHDKVITLHITDLMSFIYNNSYLNQAISNDCRPTLATISRDDTSLHFTHMSTRFDPSEAAYRDAVLLIESGIAARRYEYIVEGDESYLEPNDNTVVIQQKLSDIATAAGYSVAEFKGRRFILAGGGWDLCLFRSLDNLIDSFRDRDENIEIHLAPKSVFAKHTRFLAAADVPGNLFSYNPSQEMLVSLVAPMLNDSTQRLWSFHDGQFNLRCGWEFVSTKLDIFIWPSAEEMISNIAASQAGNDI